MEEEDKDKFYMIWDDNEEGKQRGNTLYAPKEKLPGNVTYNIFL
jgi:hypothetical protein